MKIETKYNIGDMVRYKDDYDQAESVGIIQGRRITEISSIEVSYYINEKSILEQDILGKIKEE